MTNSTTILPATSDLSAGDSPSGSPASQSQASLRSYSRPASTIAYVGLGILTGAAGALLTLALLMAKGGAFWPAVTVAAMAAGLLGLALMPMPVLEALKLVAPRLPFGGPK